MHEEELGAQVITEELDPLYDVSLAAGFMDRIAVTIWTGPVWTPSRLWSQETALLFQLMFVLFLVAWNLEINQLVITRPKFLSIYSGVQAYTVITNNGSEVAIKHVSWIFTSSLMELDQQLRFADWVWVFFCV